MLIRSYANIRPETCYTRATGLSILKGTRLFHILFNKKHGENNRMEER